MTDSHMHTDRQAHDRDVLTHECMQAFKPAYTLAHTRVCTHTQHIHTQHTHSHMHAHTHTHTHTHTLDVTPLSHHTTSFHYC